MDINTLSKQPLSELGNLSTLNDLLNQIEIDQILTYEKHPFCKQPVPLIKNGIDILYADFYDQQDPKFRNSCRKISELLQKYKHVVMIGVSGAGKTRTLIDFAHSHYLIYIDCSKDAAFLELISLCLNEFSNLYVLESNFTDAEIEVGRVYFQEKCRYFLLAFLLSRLLVLENIMNRNNDEQYFQWHLYERSDTAQHLFKSILLNLIKSCNILELSYHFSVLMLKLGKKVYFAFDECQILLDQLKKVFQKPVVKMEILDGQLSAPCSLFYFLVHNMVTNLSTQTLWSGTHLGLEGVSFFLSASAGDKRKEHFIFTDFDYLDPVDIKRMMKFFLQIEDIPEEDVVMKNICYCMQGRPRIFSSFCKELLQIPALKNENLDQVSKNEILQRVCKNYFRFITNEVSERNEEFSLYNSWKKMHQEYKRSGFQVLLDMLLKSIQHQNGYLLKINSEIDLANTGLFTPKEVIKDNVVYQMIEPVSMTSLRNYFIKSQALHDDLCDCLFHIYSSPFTNEILLHSFTGHQCMLGWWKEVDMKKVLDKDPFVDLGKYLANFGNPKEFHDLREDSVKKFISLFKKTRAEGELSVILPPHSAGPDVICGNMVFHIKSTWFKEKLTNLKQLNNRKYTNIEKWFPNRLENGVNFQELDTLLKSMENELYHICIELPDSRREQQSEVLLNIQNASHPKVFVVNLNDDFSKSFFKQRFATMYRFEIMKKKY